MDSLYLSVSHRLPHVPRRSVERASPASADPSPIKMEVEIISTGSMSTPPYGVRYIRSSS